MFRRRRAAGHQARSELDRRMIGKGNRMRRFPVETADAGRNVLTMLPDDLFQGQLPNPRIERKRPVPQVLRQPLGCPDERLLDNVRRIDPARKPRIHTDAHHPLKAVSVPYQESLAGLTVARRRLPHQFLGIGLGRISHSRISYF